MLSGEGNAEKRWKTTICLISKKATFHVQHTFFCTFLCRRFARPQRETSRWNFLVTRFMEEMSFFFFHFFFTAAHFHLALVAAYHRRYIIIMLFFQQKSVSFVIYLSLSRPLSPFFSFSCAGLPPTFSFSLSFSCSISKFVDMTINLSLILQTTRTQKHFPLSVFAFSVNL